MNSKRFAPAFWLVNLATAGGLAMAAEPVLDLRTPAPRNSTQQFATMQVDDRPGWLQRMDSVVRSGWTIACLRPGRRADFVLGAHPDGYIGVYTTPAAGSSRRRSC